MGKIYMPDTEQSRELIEQAWKDFCEKAEEAGWPISVAEGTFFQDIFVSGYCYGHNDALEVVLSQLNVGAELEDFLNGSATN